MQPVINIKKSLVKAFLISVLVAATPSHSATVYKWTDENGVIHYGDKKPEDQASTVMKVSGGKPGTPSATTPNEKGEEATMTEEEKLAAKNKKAIEENCATAQTHIEKLNSANRIRINEEGKLRFLSEEEKQEKLKSAQEYLTTNCKK